MIIGQLANHIRHDMHDMGIAFHDKLFCGFDRPNLGYFACVISPQIKQHQVLGQLFFIGEQISLKCGVLFRRCTAWASACNGADRYLWTFDLHQNLGAGANHLISTKIKVEHVR